VLNHTIQCESFYFRIYECHICTRNHLRVVLGQLVAPKRVSKNVQEQREASVFRGYQFEVSDHNPRIDEFIISNLSTNVYAGLRATSAHVALWAVSNSRRSLYVTSDI